MSDHPTHLPRDEQAGRAPARSPRPETVALLVSRSRAAAALAGFGLGAYAAHAAGHDLAASALRGLVAGVASALAVWALALAFAAVVRRDAAAAHRDEARPGS